MSENTCKKGEKFKLEKGLRMVCLKNSWVPKGKSYLAMTRSDPGGPPCADSVGVDQCLADRGHCNQYTSAGKDMEQVCPGTCGMTYLI